MRISTISGEVNIPREYLVIEKRNKMFGDIYMVHILCYQVKHKTYYITKDEYDRLNNLVLDDLERK